MNEIKTTTCIKCLNERPCYPVRFDRYKDTGTHYVCQKCIEEFLSYFQGA